jgi:esterase/lipase superfamily enzyme
MHREYHKWFSPSLGRDMELMILGHSGARVLVFPTRVGRYFDYENFGIHDGVRDRVEGGLLQLVCVDSIDAEAFYCNWCHPADRVRRHMRYEAYLLDEVLPLTEHRNPGRALIAHGCSLGAYHAVNLAFRHPGRFVKVVALSGRYDLTVRIEDFGPLLDGYFDETVYYNMPSHYVPNLSDQGLLAQMRRLHIVLVVGRDDPFLPNNQHLSEHLNQRGIPHEFHVWDGRAHKAPYCPEMARLYF